LVQKIELLEKREKSLNYKEKELENNIQKTNNLYKEQKNELIKISNMSVEEAKKELFTNCPMIYSESLTFIWQPKVLMKAFGLFAIINLP
ncbi:unnamed protein product, partial [marine sediment metagenome]